MVFGCEGKDYLGIVEAELPDVLYPSDKDERRRKQRQSHYSSKGAAAGPGQKLSEACVVDLSNGSILLTEKKV